MHPLLCYFLNDLVYKYIDPIHYNTSQAEARETARQIEALGQRALVAQADLTQVDQIKDVVVVQEVELEEQVFVADYQVPLTNKEVMEKGVELADCHREQDGIAEELKEAKDDAKAKLSPVEARIKELVRQIHSKKEQREVECQRRWK